MLNIRVIRLGIRVISVVYMKGFTLIEIVLTFGILALLTFVGLASLGNFNTDKALTLETHDVVSLISKARSFTLSAKNGSAYGVHLEATKAVLFAGPAYSPSATGNEVHTLNKEVTVSSVSLAGGGSDILFSKLTGATTQTGTITLASVRRASQTKVITVTGTGTVSSN